MDSTGAFEEPTREQYAVFGRQVAALFGSSEEWDSDLLETVAVIATARGFSIGDQSPTELAAWQAVARDCGVATPEPVNPTYVPERWIYTAAMQAVDDDEAGGASFTWHPDLSKIMEFVDHAVSNPDEVDTEVLIHKLRVPAYVMPHLPLDGGDMLLHDASAISDWAELTGWKREGRTLVSRTVVIGTTHGGGEARRLAHLRPLNEG